MAICIPTPPSPPSLALATRTPVRQHTATTPLCSLASLHTRKLPTPRGTSHPEEGLLSFQCSSSERSAKCTSKVKHSHIICGGLTHHKRCFQEAESAFQLRSSPHSHVLLSTIFIHHTSLPSSLQWFSPPACLAPHLVVLPALFPPVSILTRPAGPSPYLADKFHDKSLPMQHIKPVSFTCAFQWGKSAACLRLHFQPPRSAQHFRKYGRAFCTRANISQAVSYTPDCT